jgi:2,3-bisphosphoglycerate-independent phosphoglycerate mutase
MLFLDGVGLGLPDAATNPFFAARLPALSSLCGGQLPSLREPRWTHKAVTLLPLDANLGVDGLPQSGTGQTALFTGVNASKLIGKHFGPHPYSTLRPVIQERNVFKQLLMAGRRPYFANAFPQRFFDYVNKHRARLTVTSLSCTMSGIPLLKAVDLKEGRGVSADITSAGWRELGYPDMPTIHPAEAGRRLVELTSEHDFVLFEYWKTDYAGHSENFAEAIEVLERLDGMLAGIIEAMDIRSTLLLMTSDHGNIEDMSTKTHTRNPVPAILYGRHHDVLAARLHAASSNGADLTHITPLLMECITARQ